MPRYAPLAHRRPAPSPPHKSTPTCSAPLASTAESITFLKPTSLNSAPVLAEGRRIPRHPPRVSFSDCPEPLSLHTRPALLNNFVSHTPSHRFSTVIPPSPRAYPLLPSATGTAPIVSSLPSTPTRPLSGRRPPLFPATPRPLPSSLHAHISPPTPSLTPFCDSSA
jgi:hypothetical protein